MLPDGFFDVANSKLVTVVTHLQMDAPTYISRVEAPAWTIESQQQPIPLDWYRDLYRRIGERWLWFSRLIMGDEELSGLLNRPGSEVFALTYNGQAEGLLELHFDGPECELVFFGVTEAVRTLRAGRDLMAFAINHAWARPVSSFTTHTCTMDHPNALPFYIRCGFRPTRRQVEIMDDPRLTGRLSVASAPHMPVLEQ